MVDDNALERRSSLRLYEPCAVRVRGRDADGRFEQISFVDDLSRGGLYVRLTREVAPGTRLTAMVRLPTGAAVVARGDVLRLDARGQGQWGVAMRFNQTRLGRMVTASA